MLLEEVLVGLLEDDPAVSAIVDDRIFPVIEETDAASPYVTYQVTGIQRIRRTHDGVHTHDITTIQLDVWSDQEEAAAYRQVIDAAWAIRNLLDNTAYEADGLRIDDIAFDGWRDLPEWREGQPPLRRRQSDYVFKVRI